MKKIFLVSLFVLLIGCQPYATDNSKSFRRQVTCWSGGVKIHDAIEDNVYMSQKGRVRFNDPNGDEFVYVMADCIVAFPEKQKENESAE